MRSRRLASFRNAPAALAAGPAIPPGGGGGGGRAWAAITAARAATG
eukprot:CAMPEP_0175314590 /NCGR_PEP_ID=MMETSP0093-20121207/68471_1 /TAXON_ID=311494 /ORGANISM="Alexandrium monilatum, Strain CCMP3105" /LENGTH=45 /DNA_ID= /DNA_START= /DNA_END= /DNA_ORIENTATION=